MDNIANSFTKRGRKPLPWDEKSDKSKREEIFTLCNELKNIPKEKVMRAVIKMLKETGDKGLSSVIKNAWNNPEAEIVQKKMKTEAKPTPLTKMDGLGLILDCQLSKHQYSLIREKVNSCGEKLMPCYRTVANAKVDCRPPPSTVIITETSACVSVQALLEHTSVRIVQLCYSNILEDLLKTERSSEVLTLTCSYGFDGSSGQSNYKQGYKSNPNASAHDDSSLFVTTLIPLILANEVGNEFWRNRTPQSTRFCRPIRMLFQKETRDLVLAENEILDNEIRGLNTITVVIGENHFVQIKFKMLLTIIDGKILSILTGVNSSLSCPICEAVPNNFNDLRNLGTDIFEPKDGVKRLVHGVSPLHCFIRFFEFLIHLSYRLPIKKWRIPAQLKPITEARKREIQKRFWNELSLRVDYPSSGGAGTSNDGNTARRAFSDYRKFAEILEVDEKLIFDLRTILLTFASQLPIDHYKFDLHCRHVLVRYTNLYSWYKLPSSLHKVLVHGAQIIRACEIPLGMLSEEGAECRNKLYRQDREKHTRKMNRVVTMTDLFYRAMDTSDPVISSGSMGLRETMRKRKSLPPEVMDLLLPIETEIGGEEENDETADIFIDTDFSENLDQVVLEVAEDDISAEVSCSI